MAKKNVARELCMFCDQQPCKCDDVVLRSKVLRKQHSDPTTEASNGVPERHEGSIPDGVRTTSEDDPEPTAEAEPDEDTADDEDPPW